MVSGSRPKWEIQGLGPAARPGKAQGSQGEAFGSDSSAIERSWRLELTTVLHLRHTNLKKTPSFASRPSDFTARGARDETAIAISNEEGKSRPCDFTTRVARQVAKVPRTPRAT